MNYGHWSALEKRLETVRCLKLRYSKPSRYGTVTGTVEMDMPYVDRNSSGDGFIEDLATDKRYLYRYIRAISVWENDEWKVVYDCARTPMLDEEWGRG